MPPPPYDGVTELAKAALHRLEDAQTLLAAGRDRGAMYLAGYAVECLLKAKLMRMFGCRQLQELETELQRRGILGQRSTVFTHELKLLLQWTQALDRARQNAAFWPSFVRVNRWVPAWRYRSTHVAPDDAQDYIAAVQRVVQWIEHNV